jgi:hypothetical protein
VSSQQCRELPLHIVCKQKRLYSVGGMLMIDVHQLQSTMNINAFRGSYVGSVPRSFVGSYQQAGHANDV